MFIEVSEIINELDTSVSEISSIVMSSMPCRFETRNYNLLYEYRDVSIIKRSIRTSDCAFIHTEVTRTIQSSKTRVLSSDTTRQCSLEAQRLISRVIESQKIDTRISMRAIYESFLKNQRVKNYGECDEILRSINVEKTDIEVLVSFLMASYPFRYYLPSRSKLYSDTFDKAKLIFPITEAKLLLCNLR